MPLVAPVAAVVNSAPIVSSQIISVSLSRAGRRVKFIFSHRSSWNGLTSRCYESAEDAELHVGRRMCAGCYSVTLDRRPTATDQRTSILKINEARMSSLPHKVCQHLHRAQMRLFVSQQSRLRRDWRGSDFIRERQRIVLLRFVALVSPKQREIDVF